MEKYMTAIEKRIELLRKAISAAERDMEGKNYPEGRLRISNVGGYQKYFQVNNKDCPGGSYIPRTNIKLVKALAQKEYNKDFLNKARDELKKLERSTKILSGRNAELVYENSNDTRKKLIRPYILPDEIYAGEWQKKEVRSSNFLVENKVYETKKGESVRSKSEAIIADILYELDIPYHYERILALKSNVIRYPDFTLLKKSTREEIYLEHFGLLDDEGYREKFFEKLDDYRKNGIYPGKNLLFTFETKEHPLDIKGIRKMFKEILL